MSDIAIRVDHLSKLYPAVAPRARHLGHAHPAPGLLRSSAMTLLPIAMALSSSRQSFSYPSRPATVNVN